MVAGQETGGQAALPAERARGTGAGRGSGLELWVGLRPQGFPRVSSHQGRHSP